MYIDALLQFSSAQALTTTAVSTNVVDVLNARDLGISDAETLELAITVGTALTGGTSVQIQFQGSTDNSTFVTLAESRAYPAAMLTAGAKLFPIDWPANDDGAALFRYYRLNYVIVGTFSAGTINAAAVLDRSGDGYAGARYPAGITIAN